MFVKAIKIVLHIAILNKLCSYYNYGLNPPTTSTSWNYFEPTLPTHIQPCHLQMDKKRRNVGFNM